MPASRTLSRAELHAELIAINARDADAEVESLRKIILPMIGLVPADDDIDAQFLALSTDQIAGFYDPKTQSLTLISGESSDPIVDQVLLAHELQHALDDQILGLERIASQRPPSLDAELAAASVIEGSATVAMMRWMVHAIAEHRITLNDLIRWQLSEKNHNNSLNSVPTYYRARMLAPYMIGLTSLLGHAPTQTDLMGPDPVAEKLRNYAQHMPLSTEQLLHPGNTDVPNVIDEAAILRSLPEGARCETIGELNIAILTGISARPDAKATKLKSWTNRAATGWGGDRICAVGTSGIWVTEWDSTRDRGEFLKGWKHHPAAVFSGATGAVFMWGEQVKPIEWSQTQ